MCLAITMIEGTSTSHKAMPDTCITHIAPFDPTKKKKKKKVPIQRQGDDSQHSSMEREDMLPMIGGRNIYLGLAEEKGAGRNSTLMDYNMDAVQDLHDSGEKDVKEGLYVQQSRCTRQESKHDYDYKELLQRVLGFVRENNPELAGDKQRTVLKPPQIFPEGTTKTVFANFMDLCKLMHREPEQVMTFMLTELGTSGSLDGENRLVVQGRFSPRSLESVLQTFINEYVLCNICRCPDTNLLKENLVLLLQCDLCGSERSVTSIGVGYGTLAERRKTRQNLGFETL